ncbi:MAG: cupredoxin domain-containing protein [Actinomycetota bacterium]
MTLRALVLALVVLAACESEPEGQQATPSPSPVPTASPSPTVSPTPEAERACTDATLTGDVSVPIAARDFYFDPNCLIVLGGQDLTVRNTGGNTHNFTIEDSPVGFDLEPGLVNRTEAIGGAVPPGTYRFYCVYHESEGMEGEITISAAG